MSDVQTNISNLTLFKSDFTYRELKKQCILRGMDFEEATNSGFPHLSVWLLDHRFRDEVPHLLLEYDQWVEAKLLAMGKDYLVHPSLRLSFVNRGGEVNNEVTNEDGEVKPKRGKVKKLKREKNEAGLYTGTKKAYTYKLVKDGLKTADIVKAVIEQFPDAKEKSIKIWANRAKKEI